MVIDIRDLVKEYGQTRALDGLSLTLENGIYGLLGPNGAGKSKLINILTDNIKRSSGTVLCDGEEITQLGKRSFKIGGFPGGMKRRILLVQALLGQPEFLILDEPTAGLVPKERIALRNSIARSSKNRIVLVATHIVSDIECLASSIIILDKGKVVRCDTPGRLLQMISGKVGVVHCREEELPAYQENTVSAALHRGRKISFCIWSAGSFPKMQILNMLH